MTNAAGGLLSNANNSGHAEGTTKSAVSEGTVIVRHEDKQKQDVNELNRDTEHANDGSINPIFDKEKEQNRLKQSQLIGEIGNQTMDIIRTEGEIAGYKAQKDPDLTDKDNYIDKLRYQYGQDTLDKAGEAALTEYLDAYATQLQLRGMSEADAFKAVEQILKYPSSASPDLSAEYNKALGQLSTEERQAMIGTDALLAGPGRASQLMRLALISGGHIKQGLGFWF
nr:hypothetical protein [Providencia alcalifaciens]